MTCEMCGRPIDRANSLLVDLEAGIDEPGEEDWIWVCEQCAAEIDATQEAPELSETERTPAGFARRQGARS